MVKRALLLIVLPSVLFANSFSQTEEQFLPSEIKQSTIVTEPVSLNKGFFRLGSVVAYSVADKMFNEEGKRVSIMESSWGKDWSYSLLGQYGITDRLQVDLMIPYRNLSMYNSWNYLLLSQDQLVDKTWRLKGAGLGDIALYIRYQLLTEKSRRPSLVGDLDVTVPTGSKNPTDIKDIFDYRLPTGYGEFDLGLRLQLRKIIYPVSYSIYTTCKYGFGGTKLFNATDPEELSFRSGARIDTGGRFSILLNDWIALSNEVNYYYSGKGEVENIPPDELISSWAVSYEGSLVFQIKQFRIAEAVRIPVQGANTSTDPIYVLILQYLF